MLRQEQSVVAEDDGVAVAAVGTAAVAALLPNDAPPLFCNASSARGK